MNTIAHSFKTMNNPAKAMGAFKRDSAAKANVDSFKKSTPEENMMKKSLSSAPATTSVLRGFAKAAVLLLGIAAAGAVGGAFAGSAIIGGVAGKIIGGLVGLGGATALAAGSAKLMEKM